MYNVKVKKYREMTRIYRFQNPVGRLPGNGVEVDSLDRWDEGLAGPRPSTEENRRRSLSRTKQMIYDYAIMNHWEWFITMTFDGEKVDRYDYAAVSKKMSQWLDNQRKNNAPGMKYMLVPEQHKDGAWHFHGLLSNTGSMKIVDSGKIDVRSGRQIYNITSFRTGLTTATVIGESDKAVNYITKYVTKESDGLLKGKKRYWNSRNLELPEEQVAFLDSESYWALIRKLSVKKESTFLEPIQIETPDYKNSLSICEIR